jgi:hypothetical protein
MLNFSAFTQDTNFVAWLVGKLLHIAVMGKQINFGSQLPCSVYFYCIVLYVHFINNVSGKLLLHGTYINRSFTLTNLSLFYIFSHSRCLK